jgi:hypothetical protein
METEIRKTYIITYKEFAEKLGIKEKILSVNDRISFDFDSCVAIEVLNDE